jgi:hypothetical protein
VACRRSRMQCHDITGIGLTQSLEPLAHEGSATSRVHQPGLDGSTGGGVQLTNVTWLVWRSNRLQRAEESPLSLDSRTAWYLLPFYPVSAAFSSKGRLFALIQCGVENHVMMCLIHTPSNEHIIFFLKEY